MTESALLLLIANAEANVEALAQVQSEDVNLIAAVHYQRTALLHLQAALATLQAP